MSENVETCCNYCADRVDIIGDLTTVSLGLLPIYLTQYS